MLKQLFELAERLLAMTRDIRGNQENIKRLDRQVEKLTAAVQELAFEVRRLRESEFHEREKMALRLENSLLHFERRLLSEGDSGGLLDTLSGSEKGDEAP